MNIKKFLIGAAASALLLSSFAGAAFAAGNPSADADCSTVVADSLLGQTGTRADLYGCKPIGNSGEEQGIYTINNASSADLGYTVDHGTCNVLVKWSGDYGETPYLDFGTVFNNTKCSDGFVEIWGDRFDDRVGPTNDPYGSTPYVWSIGGQGSQIHP
jgi:hypothetical protein